MIAQATYLVDDEDWLEYAAMAERHFISPMMTPGEQQAMRQGLALGYEWARRRAEGKR